MTALHTVGILSTNFTCNAFPTVLKEFPHAEHLLAAFPLLCGPTGLRSSDCGGQGHLMQPSITLLLGEIALTQPGGVLGHCPVEKQMIVSLSMLNAVVAMLVKYALNSKYITDRFPPV